MEQPISERQLVRNATVDPYARQELKEGLFQHVTSATKKFMESHGIEREREHELIEVGMVPFDRVFNIYIKNAHDRNEKERHFYFYYNWWMRKAIFEYLHSQTKS